MSLRREIANELHKPVRRNFPRRRVTLKGLKDTYQADLVEVIPYSRENKGMKYILTIINCLSKFGHAIPLKSKSAVVVAEALESILKKHKMNHLHTDQGTEWFNKNVKKLMEKYEINHYHTFSDMKASIVERWNRTIKEKMWKHFTAQGNYKWLSLLPEIVKKYNSTKHRTTGMRPKDVRQKHVGVILKKVNKPAVKSKIPKFQVDDRVRISKYKHVFKKGYLPNWTNEIFRIFAVKPTVPVTYILQDMRGEIIKGGFYEQEISMSKTGDTYLVEKVLKRRGNKVFVRWLGFNRSHDSWIDKKNVVM